MGIDYDGGMIVGEIASKLDMPEEIDWYSWLEENDLDSMSQYYDCELEERYIGFRVDNVLVSEIDGKWLNTVKILSQKFEKLFGVPARLIGTQDIY